MTTSVRQQLRPATCEQIPLYGRWAAHGFFAKVVAPPIRLRMIDDLKFPLHSVFSETIRMMSTP